MPFLTLAHEKSERNIRPVLLTAALLIYAGIVLMRLAQAGDLETTCKVGFLCPDRWLTPADSPPGFEPRSLLSFALSFVILAIIPPIQHKLQDNPWFSWPVTATLALLAGQFALAATTAAGLLQQPLSWIVPVHLLLSLLVLGLLLIPTVISFYPNERLSQQTLPGAFRMISQTFLGRLSILALASIFVSLVSGAAITGNAAISSCLAWPLCTRSLWPTEIGGWLGLFHRFSVGVSGLLLVVFLFQVWRTRRQATMLLASVSAACVLFSAQSLLGALILTRSAPLDILGLHQATAVGVWTALVIALVASGIGQLEIERGALKLSTGFWRPALLQDFLALTKPLVVALLLFTTFAGMVIGAHAWPSLQLVFFTLLGGALAAGGCGAINQFIDRRDDARMQRTERRPLPAGRLAPGEALAFGVSICLASLYVMVVFVNWLAASLTLAGILYYLLIYSLWLKKSTVQNIVIGGGAGAIPPLVGWAAATQGLDLQAVLLFILVFLWTPPHFWALAIVRRKDYARAGVPMLPVVRGPRHTRWQIFLYSLELVAFTLLLPLFGLGSLLYLSCAVVLGAGLLGAAWKVWRGGGNKHAWKLYRYSSLYLGGVFMALMVDALTTVSL